MFLEALTVNIYQTWAFPKTHIVLFWTKFGHGRVNNQHAEQGMAPLSQTTGAPVVTETGELSHSTGQVNRKKIIV